MAGRVLSKRPVLAALLGFAAVVGTQSILAVEGAGSERSGAPQATAVGIGFDEPRPGTVLTGFTLINGWAADLASGGPGIDSDNLQIWLGGGNGTPLGFASYGWPREDVAARLGDAGQVRTGFRMGWETCTFPAGDYHLVAYGWRRGTEQVGIAETHARVGACATPSGGELFADALADERSYWLRGSGTQCAFRYADGAYHARKLPPARAEDCAAWDNDATVFGDFAAEVDVRLLDPAPARFATFAFRHGVAEYSARFRAGYSVHLFPARGAVRLVYDRGQEYTTLAEVSSTAIRGGDATNRVGIVAVGPHLRVLVNGQTVIETHDDRVPWGVLSLGAGAPQGDGAEAAFRNLVVRRAP